MSTVSEPIRAGAGQRNARPLTGAQAVAEVIAAQERPMVYGMPGGYTMHIYDALFSLRDRVETHLVRQESIATVMAEAQGRLTGQPAFVIGQGAWVLGNAGIGIMEAHLGASPVVLLIDATDGGAYSHLGPYQAGYGGYGAYDLPAAMSAITKRTFVAGDPTQALQMTQLAIKHATSGEPGPVAVIFHGRSLFERLDPAVQPPTYLDRSYASPAAPVASDSEIDSAVALLRSAARPVIVSGNGVRLAKAEDRLLAFARAIGAPVATTPGGKGTFPETDELAVGVIGSFGHDTANTVVGDADLVIAVGTKLGATDTANAHPALINARRQKIIQLDVEPLNLSWTYPADVMVLGDAADTLARLRRRAGHTTDGPHRVATARAKHGYFGRPFSSEPGKLSGRDVVRILSEELADDAVVTCDAGENRLFVLRDFQAKPGGTVLQPNGGGGMAYAIPSAMAVAVNFANRPAVAVCGDGGFSMSLHSLVSAVELGLNVTVVVLDNNVLGWVYNGQRGRVISSEFQKFDYVAVASAIGASARSVDTLEAAREAIRDAQASPGVSVVVAMTTKEDRYQDVMSALNPHDVYAVPEE
ncbi:acetolactate synthase-1/2/3 large subunit [Streptomyces sp. 3213]|uniref:thiamine pyrophosphate-binding protein n=1 Tax=Streptomyces sp. 3213.3 TaxID=1855348 RepID=UPI000894F6B8|nr:thiamine pyrophosphate-binding protein [Streptomyces sp. 3213.3]SEF04636.1 acetolactate synthase-1/2/3 large subunit [Streptomyces sp. 3213] [Streptomyces sp. 3213.3]